MTGERKNTYQDANYGNLIMRTFDIDGNEINAFYDDENNLVFVRDNTINAQKPNVLLVINPDGDKKWDEILSSQYGVDLETIRPKVDNKYQKLDIEYSGLPVYENLINAYNSGEDLEEHLNQLAILRDSAIRHSAMTRLSLANETIAKTNTTIVKTKETIVRLEARIKTLRSNLSTEKKSIGKVNTKQSASKILKLESQIEATNEKLKRAKKRLESAQKRLEIATADAELASNLLNQPVAEVKKQAVKNKPVVVAPKYPVQTIEEDEEFDNEEDDIEDDVTEDEITESDVKPLFSEDPQILNDNIAFKPIEFNAPTFTDELVVKEDTPLPVVEPEEPAAHLESRPVLESFTPIQEEPVSVPESIAEEKTEIVEERPVLETMKPIDEDIEVDIQADETPVIEPAPVVPAVEERPVAPIAPTVNTAERVVALGAKSSKPGFLYYILLLVLIVLSIFTLWLYQRNMTKDTTPVLAVKASETTVLKPVKKVVDTPKVDEESVFLTDAPVTEKAAKEIESDTDVEPVSVSESVNEPEIYTGPVDDTPVVIDAVPGRLNTSGFDNMEEENQFVSEEDILATKPVFEPGAKYDNMFVNEGGYVEPDDEYSDYFYDEEEAAYQKENM